MAGYEQMEFDVRLESDRDLQENVNLAIDFACKQVQQERQKPIENRHEAYGILAEQYARVQKSMKDVNDSFKKYALILPLDDAAAVEASNSIVNAATEAALVVRIPVWTVTQRLMNTVQTKQFPTHPWSPQKRMRMQHWFPTAQKLHLTMMQSPEHRQTVRAVTIPAFMV